MVGSASSARLSVAEVDVGLAHALLLGERHEVGAGLNLLIGGVGCGEIGEGDLLQLPALRLAELLLVRLVGGLEIGLGDLNLVLDRLGRDGKNADLAEFGLGKLALVIRRNSA